MDHFDGVGRVGADDQCTAGRERPDEELETGSRGGGDGAGGAACPVRIAGGGGGGGWWWRGLGGGGGGGAGVGMIKFKAG